MDVTDALYASHLGKATLSLKKYLREIGLK